MSKLNKDPAILFYPKDWIEETEFLSFEDKGKLIDLRTRFFNHGRLSEEKVKCVVGELPASLLKEGLIKKDKSGMYYCEVVEELKKRRENFKNRRSEDGKKGNVVKKIMKELNVDKDEAKRILSERDGMKFGKAKYPAPNTLGDTLSVRNKGNAFVNENGNKKQNTVLEDALFKLENQIPLNDLDRFELELNRLNYPDQYDDKD